MKNLMTLLVCAVMVLTSAMGAKAQFDDAFVKYLTVFTNVQINESLGLDQDEAHVTPNDFAPMQKGETARDRFLNNYTSTEVLGGRFTILTPKGERTVDTTMTVCLLNVRKLKGNSRYDGVITKLYGHDPNFSDPRRYLILGYESSAIAQTTPQGGDQGGQQAGPQGSATNGGLTGQLLTDSNGNTYVVINQDGKSVLIRVVAPVPAGTQQPQTPSQGGGQGMVNRTATVSTTVSQSGDQDLVAQISSASSSSQDDGAQRKDNVRTQLVRPGEVLLNEQANGQTLVLGEGSPIAPHLNGDHVKMMIRHNYDLGTLAPTDATTGVVEARHRWRGVGSVINTTGFPVVMGGGVYGGFGRVVVQPQVWGSGPSHPCNPRNYPAY